MPSLLYLQTLCSVTYAEHEGNPLVSGLGVTAQSAALGQECRIAHLPPPCQAVAAGSVGMVFPLSCIPRLCQFGSQQDLQIQQRSVLPSANLSPRRGQSTEVKQGREMGRVPVPPSPRLGCRAGHAASATTALPVPGLGEGWHDVHPAAGLTAGRLTLGLHSQTDAGEWDPPPQAIRETQPLTRQEGLRKWLGTLTTCLVVCKSPRHTFIISLSLPYTLQLSGSAPKSAFPNAAHCCTCSDFCIGLEGVKMFACFKCCQALTNRGESSPKSKDSPEMGLSVVPEVGAVNESDGVPAGAKLLPVPPDTQSSSSILHSYL